MTGLLLAGAVLLAMGWFAIGWIARGQENRKYAESRMRTLATQAVAAHREPPAHPVWDAQRMPIPPPPAVVHVVHTGALPPRGYAPVAYPYPEVIDERVVRELPAGWS